MSSPKHKFRMRSDFRNKSHTIGAPSNDVHRGRVSAQSRQVFHTRFMGATGRRRRKWDIGPNVGVDHPDLCGSIRISLARPARATYPNMVVLTACGDPILLLRPLLCPFHAVCIQCCRRWTRLLARHRLEVAGRDWLGVVPSNF